MAAVQTQRDTVTEPVAIIGLGCVLPGAFSPAAFWEQQIAGASAIGTLNGGAVDWERYVDSDPDAPDRTVTIAGARPDGWEFDWRRFRVPPLEAKRINPVHLMAVDAGAQALADVQRIPNDRAGLFMGTAGFGWQRDGGLRVRLDSMLDAVGSSSSFSEIPDAQRQAIVEEVVASLDSRLEPVTEDTIVNTAGSVAVGRLAMRFDLHGGHFAIDAGSASGLAALDVALRSLRDGTVDLALVGGASELLTPLELVAYSKRGDLTRGRLASLDARADGTVLGEGAAMFALKRLGDAIHDGERIRAIVAGIGGSSDGATTTVDMPSAERRALAMRRAYENGEVDPATVGFVECDAPGVPAQDTSEVQALASVYAGVEGEPVALGSAKPSVGHLGAGSGAVGLLRAVLALEHGRVPAQINFESAHPDMQLEASPLRVAANETALEPRGGWPRARAAVSAFGIGGSNFHAVLEAYDAGVRPSSRRPRPEREPIAVVGMGGHFPTGKGVQAFWDSLLEGADATREIPPQRWSAERFCSPDRDRQEKAYTSLGCFIDGIPAPEEAWRFDQAELDTLDPSQLVALSAAEEALDDAGWTPERWDREMTGVMIAFLPYQGRKFLADIRVNFAEYAHELLAALGDAGIPEAEAAAIVAEAEARFKAQLPPIGASTLTGYLGSLNAARIARRFDFGGPHYGVASACASSQATMQAAVQALRHGVCTTVLAGGVWCDMMPEFYVATCRFNALSSTGSTPFDARADGFVPGEGGGVLVLRRLSDAERSGDPIHALIPAVGGSSDGRGRSVLAPTVDGEALAMERAVAAAGVDPGAIDYVECHGTGTALGDVVEAAAMTKAYGPGRPRPLLIGSVKSNIGHLNAAAGVPALIKAVMAVREGVIPPSLKVERPNPEIDFAAGPIEVVTETTDWRRDDGRPRRAGVSGFGVGGTNIHVIVEQYIAGRERTNLGIPTIAAGSDRRPAVPLAAAVGDDAQACGQRLVELGRELSGASPREFLEALVATQAGGRGDVRVAIVAGDPDELERRAEALASLAERGLDPAVLRGQGVFVGGAKGAGGAVACFPGQGVQYPNMLREASARFPAAAAVLDDLDEIYGRLAGRPLRPSFMSDDEAGLPQNDEDVHCAVFAANVAAFEVLKAYGFEPACVLGQSAGELSALVAAGVLSREDGLRTVRDRTLSVLALDVEDPGQMVSLACSADRARELLDGLAGYATIAADNGPSASIVSGERRVMSTLLDRCSNAGVKATPLLVSHAYHSEMIAGATRRYRATLDALRYLPPEREIYSTVTGGRLTDMPLERLPGHLESQLVTPVRLVEAVGAIAAAGHELFIECGPGGSLSTFIGGILDGRPHVTQPTLHRKVGEREQLHRALACLWVHGAVSLEGDVALALEADEAASAPSATPAAPTGEARDGSSFEEVRGIVIEELIERTGYPEDMLDLDLEIEAELGIDSIRQAAMLGAARERLGLEAEASVDMRSLNTLRKSIAYLLGRLEPDGAPAEVVPDPACRLEPGPAPVAAAPVSPPPPEPLATSPAAQAIPQPVVDLLQGFRDAIDTFLEQARPAAAPTPADPPPSAPPPPEPPEPPFAPIPSPEAAAVGFDDVRAALLGELVERTGYPEDMLDLDLEIEADLGVDSIRYAAALTAARERLGLEADAGADLRQLRTLRRSIEYLLGRVQQDPQRQASNGQPVQVAAEEAPRLADLRPLAERAALGAVTDDGGAERPPHDVTAALDGADAIENGVELAEALEYPNAGGCPLRSAWLARFDDVAGALEDGTSADGSQLVEAVCLQAAFGWYALTGALYLPVRVARVRFVDREGAEPPLRALCRLAPAAPGSRRADATVIDAAGRVVAQIEGIEGESSGASTPPIGRGSGASTWQRVVALMDPPSRAAP